MCHPLFLNIETIINREDFITLLSLRNYILIDKFIRTEMILQ